MSITYTAKQRNYVIDELIKQYNKREEYISQLRNGFIPEDITAEYEELLSQAPSDLGEDTDFDLAQYSSYFALNPQKVIGKEVVGSGYINPVITKGDIKDLLKEEESVMEAKESEKSDDPIADDKGMNESAKMDEQIALGFKVGNTVYFYPDRSKEMLLEGIVKEIKKPSYRNGYDITIDDNGTIWEVTEMDIHQHEINPYFNKLEQSGKVSIFMKQPGDADFIDIVKAPVVDTEVGKGTSISEFRKSVKSFLLENLLDKFIINEHTGEKIFFSKISIDELLQNTGPEKLRSLFHIKEIIQKASPSFIEEINKRNNAIKKASDFIYNFDSRIMIDSKWYEYSFKTFVKINNDGNGIEKIYIYSGHLPKEKPI